MPRRPKRTKPHVNSSIVVSARLPAELRRTLEDMLDKHSGPGGFSNLSHAIEHYLWKGLEYEEGYDQPDPKSRAVARAYRKAQGDAYAAIGEAIRKLTDSL